MKKITANTFLMARTIVALLLAAGSLLLVSCGFHLRGVSSASLPPELSILRVTMSGGAYPPLLLEMRNALLAQGSVQLIDDPVAAVPVLRLHGESTQNQVLAIDSSGRISAYLINYRVTFSLDDANGKELLPKQPVKLQREYTFDRLAVIATEKQSEFLKNEIRRDAVQQILRRLARVNKTTAMDGGSAGNAGAVSRPTAMDGGSAEKAGSIFPPTAMDGGSAENTGTDFQPQTNPVPEHADQR